MRQALTLCSVITILLVPVYARAFSGAGMYHTVGSVVCMLRAFIGFPCGNSIPEDVISEQHKVNTTPYSGSALVSAAATSFEYPTTTKEIQNASSTSRTAMHEPEKNSLVEYVQRDEFDAVTGSLRAGVSRALTQTPVVVQQAPLYIPVPVSSGGSARSYDADISSLWHAIALGNKIDTLSHVSISDSIFSGTFNGTFTGALVGDAVSASSLSLSGLFSGTSIVGTTLTITGTSTAATTTSAILDTHGQVCNVQAYGAVGNDSTDNYTAIMNAIHSCPAGGVVYFPPGIYRISQTIVLDTPVTLQGSYAPRWTYSVLLRTSIKPTPSFAGSHIIHVRDKTISGEVNDNNGGRIMNITIDGNSYGSAINGIYFEGLIRDWKLSNLDITQTSGDGFETAQGAGSGNARGFTIEHMSIYSPESHGFRATALNDSYI